MNIWTFLSAWNCLLLTSNAAPPPNIVIHLADDLGIGDIGCFGNKTLRTPNIDKLATEGIRLTQHLAAASFCTPSRAALLTGRYPIRSGFGPSFLPARGQLASPGGLPEAEVTFAEQVEKAGYKTALIGKWHLGVHDIFRRPIHHPLNHGFQTFYGLPLTLLPEMGDDPCIVLRLFPNLNFRMAMALIIILPSILFFWKLNLMSMKTSALLAIAVVIPIFYTYIYLNQSKFLNSVLMRDYGVIEKPVRLVGLTQRFAEEGIEFIREVNKDEKPFLLFMSWGHPHTYLAPSKKFAGKTPHGRYGDCVEELDWGIGLVNDVLEELDLTEKTLVYFTSDNGADRYEGGGDNGKYKGGKGQCTSEGGIRIPGVVRFPGRIPPNTTSDVVTSQMDFFPIISHLADVPLPTNRRIDGENILGLLEGKAGSMPTRQFLLHYERHEITAVRYMPPGGNTVWKVAYKIPDSLYQPGEMFCEFGFCDCRPIPFLDHPLLFNMTSDPSERNPIKKGEYLEYEAIVNHTAVAIEKHLTTLEDVPSQLTILKSLWYPHLLSCCNWPVCQCTESKYTDDHLR